MDLITTSLPDVIAISMSQSPGYLAPAFTVTRLPQDARPSADWLNLPAQAATFTIDGVTWECLSTSSEVSLDRENGVVLEQQFYPRVVAVLQHGGLPKHLVFLSCPNAVRDHLQDQYDENEYEVLHQACDVYTSNGWTVNAILTEIGQRAGVTIQSALPDLHLPQPTVILEKGQRFFDFLKSLLPSELTYIWQSNGDALLVDYVRPAATIASLPFDTVNLRVSRSHTPAYTCAQIVGGETLPTANLALGGSVSIGSAASPRNGQTIQDTQTDAEQTVDRTYTADVDGNLFALRSQRTTRHTGAYASVVTETFAYANDQATTYRTPRLVTRQAVETGKIVSVSSGVGAGRDHVILMSDGAMRTVAEMNALPAQNRPSILLVAALIDGEREVTTEQFDYIEQAAASRDWPEGTQRVNTLTVQRAMCKVNGTAFACTGTPAETMQAIMADVSVKYPEETWTGGHVSNRVNTALLDATLTTRRVEFVSGGSYRFVESVTAWSDSKDEDGNPVRAKMQTTTNVTTIDAERLPSNPTQYRTQPLRATLNWSGGGDGGEVWGGGEIVYPFQAQIPTNNPDDFAVWAAMLWQQATTPRASISFTTNSTFYAPGERVAGATVTSCQVSVDEDRNVTLAFTAE